MSRAHEIYEFILKNIVIPSIGNNSTYQDELLKYGRRLLGNKFKGVFASDKIPKLTNKQPYAIINLDASYMPGSHWVGIAKGRGGVIVYDSFARKTKNILPSLFKSGNGLIIDTDDDIEQHKSEENCGARVVSWILLFEHWGEDIAKLI